MRGPRLSSPQDPEQESPNGLLFLSRRKQVFVCGADLGAGKRPGGGRAGRWASVQGPFRELAGLMRAARGLSPREQPSARSHAGAASSASLTRRGHRDPSSPVPAFEPLPGILRLVLGSGGCCAVRVRAGDAAVLASRGLYRGSSCDGAL